MIDPTRFKTILSFEATRLQLEALKAYLDMNRIKTERVAAPETIEISRPHCKLCDKLLDTKEIIQGLYICRICRVQGKTLGTNTPGDIQSRIYDLLEKEK